MEKMINYWTRFEGSPNGRSKEKARITLSPRKYLALNRHAYQTIGSPPAVELFFDEHQKRIGLKPCDPHKKNAFRLRQEKGKDHMMIYASSFCTHFGISTRRTVLFDEIDIDQEGIVVLDMKKTINVSRGSR
jgi:hypothetical protein